VAVLVVDGIFRTALAFQIRPRSGWGLVLVGGIISVVLGSMIWARLSAATLGFSGGTFLLLSSVRQALTAAAR
jgi:uncharacterized membrane protein HdeD (DUF308 family)